VSAKRTPPYLEHYRELVDRVGAAFEATGWRNREFQTERFRVMAEMVDFSGMRVLDAGAGRADFAEYLLERGVGFDSMVALDAMPEMVEAIRGRKLDRVEAALGDFASEPDAFTRFGEVDAIVFSGSLNTLDEDHALAVLERAWDAVGGGDGEGAGALVFNFLSDRAPGAMRGRPTEPARRFSPVRLVDWALDKTPGVRFRHDYLGGHDATIAMLGESRSA
jgi:SAM-dependent methyltransferase